MADTILVVEDEPAIRELIGFACESSGYATLRAGSVWVPWAKARTSA